MWYYIQYWIWSVLYLNWVPQLSTYAKWEHVLAYCKWQTAGCRTGNNTKLVLLHLPQASGPPLLPLALDLLPAPTFPLLPLTTTRQCSLEVTNQDVAVESMTVIFWILSQWYAQRNCDNWIMPSKCYEMKIITLWNWMFTSAIYWTTIVCCMFVCMCTVSDMLIIHVNSLQGMHIQWMGQSCQHHVLFYYSL